ncbi:MAG TPA: LLM class flavin-dependent oxidoreductase [Acidimicrobiales bacterium]|nr:LLM class flavin-dependent oxidoreductase [Acidimicrobiales bacterium]
MEVGLALPQYDYSVAGESPLTWETLAEWACTAESVGLDSVWLSDHLFLSIEKYGAPAGDHGGFEPLATLAALARSTSTVRLGTLVLCAQLRPPAVLAKALATLDVLSGGRLIAGIGAGWFRPEYETAGIAFERPGVRVDQLAETVRVVRDVLSGHAFLPRPVQQPRPPIWVGGQGDRVLGVTAEYADGWNAGGWVGTPEAYSERVQVLERHCERIGRDPAAISRSINRYALVGEDEADLDRRWERLRNLTPPGVLDATSLEEYRQGRLVGTVDQVREQVAGWEALGVATLIVNLGAVPFSVTTTDDVEVVASATKDRGAP